MPTVAKLTIIMGPFSKDEMGGKTLLLSDSYMYLSSNWVSVVVRLLGTKVISRSVKYSSLSNFSILPLKNMY